MDLAHARLPQTPNRLPFPRLQALQSSLFSPRPFSLLIALPWLNHFLLLLVVTTCQWKASSLLQAELCPPSNSYVDVLTPCIVTVFRKGVFKGVIKVK